MSYQQKVVFCAIFGIAAVVSDNDGSAFITKAEFDSLKNNFQAQIDNYNQSIDSKIDGAIASYLAGIKIGPEAEFEFEFIAEFPTDNLGVLTCKYCDITTCKIGPMGGKNCPNGVGCLAYDETTIGTSILDAREAWYSTASGGTLEDSSYHRGSTSLSNINYLTNDPQFGNFIVPVFYNSMSGGKTLALGRNNANPDDLRWLCKGFNASSWSLERRGCPGHSSIYCKSIAEAYTSTRDTKIVAGSWSEYFGLTCTIHELSDISFNNYIFMPILTCTEGSGTLKFMYYADLPVTPSGFADRNSTSTYRINLLHDDAVSYFGVLNTSTGYIDQVDPTENNVVIKDYDSNVYKYHNIELRSGEWLVLVLIPKTIVALDDINKQNESVRLKFNAQKL